MKQTIAAVSWIALSVLAASGQTAVDTPEFEVASVKPAAAPAGGNFGGMRPPNTGLSEFIGFSGGPGTKDPGRIDYSGVNLKMLLVRAYQVRPYQISGPGWLDTERYDIVAKVPPGTDKERLQLMLQKLLTERFRISLHRETKEQPVYRLTVAKNGPKLKPPEEVPQYKDDAEGKAAREAAMRANMAVMMAAMRAGEGRSQRNFWLASATVAKFAEMLSSNLDSPVKDMTGLEGLYSFHLSWTPDDARTSSGDAASGPSIYAAIQEQLGLKLEAGKGTIEFLVIDKAEKSPVGN